MSIRVEEYICPDGSSPYADWFDSLDARAAAKVVAAKLREALIVLFGGGTKSRQQADIERAKALHAEYKARKAAARSDDKPKPPKR